MRIKLPIHEVIAGATFKATWVNSGVVPDALECALLDRNDLAVGSAITVNSGDGHYYGLLLIPNSASWFVNQWIARIGVNTYCNRQFIHAFRGDVD